MAKVTLLDEMLNRQQIIENAASYLVEQTRDWQLIKEFLCNRAAELSLTQTQQDKLERYQFIYNQQVSGRYTTPQLANMVCRQFAVEKRQAYEDIRASQEVFTAVINVNKLFEITLQLEINKQMIAEARAMQDYKSASALERNRTALLALLPQKEDNPADAFKGHVIEPVFDPRLIGAPDVDLMEVLKTINEKRDVKLNLDQITSIPFEDLDNDDKAAL